MFCLAFHVKVRFTKCLDANFIAATLIALIQGEKKKIGVLDFEDFQFISFVNRVYKKLAKVLANGLKLVFGKIINFFLIN